MASLAVARERLPSSAAFSGLTAAWLHGIDVEPCDPIEVTVPRSTGIAMRAGIRVHRAKSVADEVIQIRGFRVRSVARTIAAELATQLRGSRVSRQALEAIQYADHAIEAHDDAVAAVRHVHDYFDALREDPHRAFTAN